MKRFLLLLLGILIILGLIIGYLGYNQIYGDVVNEETIIQIHTNTEFDGVKEILSDQGWIKNEALFDQLASRMNYVKSPMRSGQFKISQGANLYEIISTLRNGSQEASDLVVNITWTVDRVAGRLDPFLELDSLSIITTLLDLQLQEELGYSPESAMTLFIPNTYQVYWNTTGSDLVRRMKTESDTFWSQKGRKEKAAAKNMTPEEVYTLASIVERETNQNEEKKRMAGVYLNRIKRGMPLQADPTVRFGIGDLTIKRVLNRHLEFDSPYNTYKYPGLPPGPISMASIASIDAVLNAEDHSYLYFCRKPDETGLHAFAKTLKAHNVNARAYHRWFSRNFG